MPHAVTTPDSFPPGQQRVTDNLEQLLACLPLEVRDSLQSQDRLEELLEIVLDLGREPEARFPDRAVYLLDRGVTGEDIDFVTNRVGAFGKDNRAGIERTLHRISAIRNRQGRIVGLTCRIGRAVYGTIDILRDVVESGKSILMLGRPGVGKTTKLREMARVLAEQGRRVVIVDTSNEIGGDGDIPHPAIGRSRRMQVAEPNHQHAVMIEAVENHMPQVVVIDEIGTEAESYAARTIAERGVQLIGTAHGNSLENLLMNPTLSDLVGGIQAVTLSDDEARRRGTQKTVLERKSPPTFDVVIEIIEVDKLAIHHNVHDTVDQLLRGTSPRPEIRVRRDDGQVEVVQEAPARERLLQEKVPLPGLRPSGLRTASVEEEPRMAVPLATAGSVSVVRIFPYGVSRSRLERAIGDLKVPARISRDLHDADAVIALKQHYRREPAKLREALGGNMPTFVIRSNTYSQMTQVLREMFQVSGLDDEELARRDVEEGVEKVMQVGEPVELLPQSAYIRRLQHQLVEQYCLASESVGTEPYRRVRITKP
ncbi:MAG TPA: R3H domain-containing nucleic acid-binding protein [Armatimonadota bacterium]|jgi:stage III sporulation protein SpoIIIAA